MLPTALRLALRPLREAVTPSVLPQPPELLLSPLKAIKKTPRSKRPSQKSILSKKKDEKDLRWWLSQKHPEAIFHTNDESVRKLRAGVLARVRKAVSRFGSCYRVRTFGSIKYGASSTKSDIDLIILDSTRPRGFDPSDRKQLPKIYKLNILAGALKHAGFIKVVPIPAAVPIVKFKDPHTKIECDINVNDQPGYWNSIMLKNYTRLSPHLRRLLIAIKRWAKPLGLNSPSPKKGEELSFSSYTFALMTVGFLQSRGLLPNLQENLGPNVRAHPFWNRKPQVLCDLRFNSQAQLIPMPGNDEISTIALFADWFKFWAEFDPARQMVDIRLGGIITRAPSEVVPLEEVAKRLDSSQMPEPGAFQPGSCIHERDLALHDARALQRWEFHTMCVIDPFIRVRNVAQSISESVFERFQEECRQAEEDLRKW